MKKQSFVTFTLIVIFSLVASSVFAEEEPWSKYPDNSEKEFMDANAFYETIDKNLYSEYKNAKVNAREKVFYKDINKVLAKFDDSGLTKVGGNGYHPERQVYVFVTVDKDSDKMKIAVFDAETEQPIGGSGP